MIQDQVPSLEQAPGGRARAKTRLPRLALPHLRLRASERRLLLAVVDVTLLWAALAIAVKARTGMLDAPGALFAYWYWFVALAVVWWFGANLVECYDLARAASGPHSVLSAAGAVGITVLIYVWIPVLTPPLVSRKLVFLFALFAASGIMLWRGLYVILFVQPNFYQCGLVLGAGLAGQSLAAALESIPSYGNPYRGTGYRILGFVDDDPAKQQAGEIAGLPVFGGSGDLLRLAREQHVDEVVLAITHRHTMSEAALEALMACREHGIAVCTMPMLYERLLGRVPVEHIGGDLNAVLPVGDGPTERLFHMVKRAADAGLGAVSLVVVALVIPFVALANAIFSPGPLFYRQSRVGRGGKLFRITKFRTMRPDAEDGTGAVWCGENDPRITPVGCWLRRTRLDEVPQLINVLRGEMSLVGPRPERPEFVEGLVAQIPFYRARHAVRPGLTGWAQVRFGYGNSIADARTKLEYDLYYVRHADLYLDLLILLKTLAVVLRLKGK